MSTFLEMANVVQEELVAGRITVGEAKAQLRVNVDIALAFEELKIERLRKSKKYSYTKADQERDRKLDEAFCCW